MEENKLKCTKCKNLLNIDNFSIRNYANKYRYRRQCKTCISNKQQKYYKKNIENISLIRKKYKTSHKKELSIKSNIYYEKNKQKIKKRLNKNRKERKRQQQIYYKKNKDKFILYQKEYYKIESNKEKRRKHIRERKKNDIYFRLRLGVSNYVRIALQRNGLSQKKKHSVLCYLNIDEIKKHIESQFEQWMNWNNQGKYNKKTWNDNDSSTWTWQLDHIIPQSDLPYDSMEHENFKKCWSIHNLRPLNAKQNHFDGVTRTRHKLKLGK